MPRPYRRGSRRKMDKFELGEISFVDSPAQTPATAEVEKAEDASLDELLDKGPGPKPGGRRRRKVGETGDESFEEFARRRRLRKPGATDGELRDEFTRAKAQKNMGAAVMLTSSEEGHQHGVRIYRGDDEDDGGFRVYVDYAAGEAGETHDHQVVMADDGTIQVSENFGHTHTIDQGRLRQIVLEMAMKSTVPEEISLVGLLAKETSDDERAVKEETEMPEDLKKAEERVAALEAENATLLKVAGLPAAQKAHYDELAETERSKFLDLDADDRAQLVADAQKAKEDSDPVIYKAADGAVYRKSDDPRLVEMAKGRDQDRKDVIKLRLANEDAALSKRAEAELANFPGKVEVRKAILKAVDGIEDETTREAALDALKSHNAKMGPALRTVGAEGQPQVLKVGDQEEADEELDRMAKELSQKEGIDYYTAYEKVSEANPDLLTKAVKG